jgi:hypothetical protein
LTVESIDDKNIVTGHQAHVIAIFRWKEVLYEPVKKIITFYQRHSLPIFRILTVSINE